MPIRRAWLPREGFTADVVARIVQNTAFNPALTLPLLLFALYTTKGRELSLGHDRALSRLKLLIYIGIARVINGFLSRGAQNNWQSSKYEWEKEIAVITGGSDGIGKNIAFLLAERGVKIASLDMQPPTFESPVSNAAASVRSTLGHPTILINNAGIANESTILKSTDTSVERIFAVNTLSHFRLVREFLPSMVTANHGTVVTVASCAAVLTAPRIVDYSCTKAAALAFHEGLAGELVTQYDAPKVRTICVCPSCVQTNMTKTIEVPDKFLLPMQKVETVAEKVVQKILSDSSGVLVIPEAASWVAWPLRMMPMWWQAFVRNGVGRSVRGIERQEEIKDVVENAQS